MKPTPRTDARIKPHAQSAGLSELAIFYNDLLDWARQLEIESDNFEALYLGSGGTSVIDDMLQTENDKLKQVLRDWLETGFDVANTPQRMRARALLNEKRLDINEVGIPHLRETPE